MQFRTSHISSLHAVVVAFGVALGIGSVSGTVAAAGQVDPEADKILKSMSTYMGGLTAFSVNIEVDNEIVDLTGRKLQFSASTSLVAQRPENLYVHRRGPVADVELIFDGKMLTVNGKGLNVYAQMETLGSNEDAVRQVRIETGLDVPAGDLLFTDSYTGLMEGVVSGDYIGTGFVNGVECQHLAFRQAKVDWQLWIQSGDTPLPMKYIITSKWVTGAPQYSARFHDWNTKPEIGSDRFVFSPPEGAKKLDEIPIDELGELMLEGEQ